MKMFQDNELDRTDVIVKRMPHKIVGANQLSDKIHEKPEFTNIRENATYWRWMMEKALIESKQQKLSMDRAIYQEWLEKQLELAKIVLHAVDPCGTSYGQQ